MYESGHHKHFQHQLFEQESKIVCRKSKITDEAYDRAEIDQQHFHQQNNVYKEANNKTKAKPQRDDWSKSLITLCYHRQSKTSRMYLGSLP